MFYIFIFASFEETNLTRLDFLKKLKYKSSYNTLSGGAEVLGPTILLKKNQLYVFKL